MAIIASQKTTMSSQLGIVVVTGENGFDNIS